jgi:hypothetical protein
VVRTWAKRECVPEALGPTRQSQHTPRPQACVGAAEPTPSVCAVVASRCRTRSVRRGLLTADAPPPLEPRLPPQPQNW